MRTHWWVTQSSDTRVGKIQTFTKLWRKMILKLLSLLSISALYKTFRQGQSRKIIQPETLMSTQVNLHIFTRDQVYCNEIFLLVMSTQLCKNCLRKHLKELWLELCWLSWGSELLPPNRKKSTQLFIFHIIYMHFPTEHDQVLMIFIS